MNKNVDFSAVSLTAPVAAPAAKIVSAIASDNEFEVFTERSLERIPQLQKLSSAAIFDMKVVAQVLPFRVNRYVLEQLIDWDNIPADPIFQLVFPQPDMLAKNDFNALADLLRQQAPAREVRAVADKVRASLNPHPAGQMDMNVPLRDEEPIPGLQHKYRETVLFFPSQGQTCHSYCSFCFRWAQFVGDKDLRFASKDVEQLTRYLSQHNAVSDILITGGDPMVMSAENLGRYLTALLAPELDHIRSIRIGTKSLSFWPQRFVHDADADQLLRLFEKVNAAGKQVALMAHYNHWRELDTPVAARAIARLRSAGVIIRSQGPLLRRINDDSEVWAQLWRMQVAQGIVPYYMFVERDTGARRYFEVPLVEAQGIYQRAQQQVSGLARTARGPSMSAAPGKVEVQGETTIAGQRVLALRFLQARNPAWTHRPFFAEYDERATWFDELRPAFGEDKFFFEDEYQRMLASEISPRHYQ